MGMCQIKGGKLRTTHGSHEDVTGFGKRILIHIQERINSNFIASLCKDTHPLRDGDNGCSPLTNSMGFSPGLLFFPAGLTHLPPGHVVQMGLEESRVGNTQLGLEGSNGTQSVREHLMILVSHSRLDVILDRHLANGLPIQEDELKPVTSHQARA